VGRHEFGNDRRRMQYIRNRAVGRWRRRHMHDVVTGDARRVQRPAHRNRMHARPCRGRRDHHTHATRKRIGPTQKQKCFQDFSSR